MIKKISILFCEWNTFGQKNIIQELEKMGYSVFSVLLPLAESTRDAESYNETKSILRDKIKTQKFNIFFSINYFSVISEVCSGKNIKYISWCNDAPLYSLFYESVKAPHNTIFSFDRKTVEKLRKKGVNNVYHLPYFSAVEHFDEVLKNENVKNRENEVSFVGSTYESRSFYEDIKDTLPEYLNGYLEGIMEAQEKIIGHNFLEKMITDEVETSLKQYITIPINDDFLEGWKFLFSNAFLGVYVSHKERMHNLKELSERYSLSIYTKDSTGYFPKATNMGKVKYDTEMPFVFRHSKINLNMTIRNIQSGVPLRVFDVLGCGGFLITNYQEEIDELFEDGEDLVMYYSLEDLIEKVGWYLAHDEERDRIARNGYQKVKKYHTLSNRLPIILESINEMADK